MGLNEKKFCLLHESRKSTEDLKTKHVWASSRVVGRVAKVVIIAGSGLNGFSISHGRSRCIGDTYPQWELWYS